MRKVLIVVVLLLSGCATNYKQPTSGKVATLVVKHLGEIPSSTAVSVFSSATCSKETFLGQIADAGRSIDNWKPEVTAKIESGCERFLAINQWWVKTNEYEKVNYHCTNLVGFIPVEGKTYVIKQKQLSFGGCSAEIIDSSSGVPPTDIKIYNANDMCTLY